MIGGQQDNLLLILQIAVQINTRAGSVTTDKKMFGYRGRRNEELKLALLV